MSRSPRPVRRLLAVAACLSVAALALAACGDESDSASGASTTAATGDATAPTVRLGFFPNITHAPALVGVAEGTFTKHLGSTKLETKTFNAGPEATEALFADALDITYIGPNPSINAFQKSNGEAIRIVSGSTSGGAAFVVKPDITKASDLQGKKVASPQLGNTQDVALRVWLKDQGLTTTTSGGGDVSVTPQANADTLTAFKAGDISGAWEPEPWATRLVQEGGGKVLVNEADLWPGGRYVTTQIIVRTEFLQKYPGTVKAILQGHLDALASIQKDPTNAQKEANDQIKSLTGKALPDAVLGTAWKNLTFTPDPIASSLHKSAEDAKSVDLLQSTDLKGIYDLSILNGLLKGAGQQAVTDS